MHATRAQANSPSILCQEGALDLERLCYCGSGVLVSKLASTITVLPFYRWTGAQIASSICLVRYPRDRSHFRPDVWRTLPARWQSRRARVRVVESEQVYEQMYGQVYEQVYVLESPGAVLLWLDEVASSAALSRALVEDSCRLVSRHGARTTPYYIDVFLDGRGAYQCRNRALVETSSEFLDTLDGPWIFSADWQSSPEVVNCAGVPSMLRGVLFAPSLPICGAEIQVLLCWMKHCLLLLLAFK